MQDGLLPSVVVVEFATGLGAAAAQSVGLLVAQGSAYNPRTLKQSSQRGFGGCAVRPDAITYIAWRTAARNSTCQRRVSHALSQLCSGILATCCAKRYRTDVGVSAMVGNCQINAATRSLVGSLSVLLGCLFLLSLHIGCRRKIQNVVGVVYELCLLR